MSKIFIKYRIATFCVLLVFGISNVYAGVGNFRSGSSNAKRLMSSVAPIVIAGNPNCADLNASGDAAFAHIVLDWGFKIDPPASGSFTLTNAPGRVLTGGMPADAGSTLTVSLTNGTTFNWSSNRSVTAVIVKGGPNANVYPYNPFAFSDTVLNTVGNGPNISHLEFCFSNLMILASHTSVGGQITDNSGRGLRNVSVTILNINDSSTQTTKTSSFGYYQFNDLPVGDSYLVTVRSKRYVFNPDTQFFTLNDAIEDLNFTGTLR